jgi:hypothetical protein
VKHRIDTSEAKPIRQQVRGTPLNFQSKEMEHLQKQLDTGVVVPSKSPWASPVVLVRNKDGGVCWCVDYRKLNYVTKKMPIPSLKLKSVWIL